MPYLSRVWINPLRPKGREFLQSPHVVHAAILGGFVVQPVTERVLWRLSVGAQATTGAPIRAELLVLSQSWPSLQHVVEQAGYAGTPDGQPVTRDYAPILERISAGAEFAFKARVNPVQAALHPDAPSPAQRRRLEAAGMKRGVRIPHRTVAAQLGWFTSRAHAWGFEIPVLPPTASPDVRMVDRQQVEFAKGAQGRRRLVSIATATFEGRLRVIDRDLFLAALLQGIGPSKAYGCGLLTLAPLPSLS